MCVAPPMASALGRGRLPSDNQEHSTKAVAKSGDVMGTSHFMRKFNGSIYKKGTNNGHFRTV